MMQSSRELCLHCIRLMTIDEMEPIEGFAPDDQEARDWLQEFCHRKLEGFNDLLGRLPSRRSMALSALSISLVHFTDNLLSYRPELQSICQAKSCSCPALQLNSGFRCVQFHEFSHQLAVGMFACLPLIAQPARSCTLQTVA